MREAIKELNGPVLYNGLLFGRLIKMIRSADGNGVPSLPSRC